MRSTPGNGKQSRILVGNFHYAQHREREIRVGYNRRALISSEVRVGITIVQDWAKEWSLGCVNPAS